jgi:thiamine transport system ATP-binding protein
MAVTGTALLQVEGASLTFPGGRAALHDVDLVVAPGEVVAVLGPSGSGKSTLLRAVAGLQALDGGRIVLDGEDVTRAPPHRRGVGLMFQDHSLFPHRDVAANVAFGLRMQRRPADEIRRRVDALLELVDLPGYGSRRVQTLSGGEQQRVALARALAPEPRLLLLDEPLGSLDRTMRDRLVTELRSLFTRLGLTVVAVTHDQAEAFTLADRLVVLDGGRVLQSGAPSALWGGPASARVAELLGFVNLLPAVVEGCWARTAWGSVAVDAPDGEAVVLIPPTEVRVVFVAAGDPEAATPSTSGHEPVAEVLSVAFQGDRSVLRLQAADGPLLEALVPSGDAPGVGEHVRVDVSAARAVAL